MGTGKTPSVVILGARGMLGHALADAFADCAPTLWDVPELDITDARTVRRALTELQPTWILNAAAYTDVDGCEENEAAAFLVNAAGTENVARSGRAIAAVVVHYSTDYVFGGKNKGGYAEDSVPAPVNAYGRTKLAGEQALQASGADYLLIRTSWLFGPYGKNFVETMLRLAAERPELTVVHDQTGLPTYTRDLAQRTRTLLEQGSRGVHHAANPPATNWYEFARAILDGAGMSTPVRPISATAFGRKAPRPACSILLNTKDAPLRPWKEALGTYLRERTSIR